MDNPCKAKYLCECDDRRCVETQRAHGGYAECDQAATQTLYLIELGSDDESDAPGYFCDGCADWQVDRGVWGRESGY